MTTRRRAIRWALLTVVGMVAGVLAVAGHVAQPFYARREATPPKAVSVEKLRADVAALTTTFGPRDSEHPEALDKAAAWLRTELEATGATVSEQPFTLDGRTFKNVVATFGPLT